MERIEELTQSMERVLSNQELDEITRYRIASAYQKEINDLNPQGSGEFDHEPLSYHKELIINDSNGIDRRNDALFRNARIVK